MLIWPWRYEYDAYTEVLDVTTHPAEMHEGPGQWFGSLLNFGLVSQKIRGGGQFDGWKVGFNSSFLIQSAKGDTLKVCTPDVFLADDRNRLLVVLEVANSQTMSSILNKVEEVWLKSSDILGIIIIKMEEFNKPRQPRASRKPVMPILQWEEWVDRTWPQGDIEYDGITWIGKYHSKMLIFLNTQLAPTSDPDTQVRCCLHLCFLPHISNAFSLADFHSSIQFRNTRSIFAQTVKR